MMCLHSPRTVSKIKVYILLLNCKLSPLYFVWYGADVDQNYFLDKYKIS